MQGNNTGDARRHADEKNEEKEREKECCKERRDGGSSNYRAQEATNLNIKEIKSLDVRDDDSVERLLHKQFLLVLFFERPREPPQVLPCGFALSLCRHQQIFAPCAGERVGDSLRESHLQELSCEIVSSRAVVERPDEVASSVALLYLNLHVSLQHALPRKLQGLCAKRLSVPLLGAPRDGSAGCLGAADPRKDKGERQVLRGNAQLEPRGIEDILNDGIDLRMSLQLLQVSEGPLSVGGAHEVDETHDLHGARGGKAAAFSGLSLFLERLVGIVPLQEADALTRQGGSACNEEQTQQPCLLLLLQQKERDARRRPGWLSHLCLVVFSPVRDSLRKASLQQQLADVLSLSFF